MIRSSLLVAFAVGGCVFAPAIDDDGYVACSSDADCGAGFNCVDGFALSAEGRCAPPPWNDEEFQTRRVLAVENVSDVELAAGTAVPVAFGGADDVLALEDVGPDARFTSFDAETGDWSVTGVYRDIVDGRGLDDDTFVVWIPLQRALPAGASDALAFLEQDTEAGTPTVKEDPVRVFHLFDDLDAFPVDGDDAIFVDAPGAASVEVRDGSVLVGDNQKVVWRNGLAPPLSVTFRARINGITCREVFLGVTANDSASFDLPAAGFFVDDDLQATGQFAPIAAAQIIEDISAPKLIDDQPNALHRYSITVDDTSLTFFVDDVEFDVRGGLTTPFEPTKLLPTVEVGGDCTVEVDAVWVTPLPTATPTVTATASVQFNKTF